MSEEAKGRDTFQSASKQKKLTRISNPFEFISRNQQCRRPDLLKAVHTTHQMITDIPGAFASFASVAHWIMLDTTNATTKLNEVPKYRSIWLNKSAGVSDALQIHSISSFIQKGLELLSSFSAIVPRILNIKIKVPLLSINL